MENNENDLEILICWQAYDQSVAMRVEICGCGTPHDTVVGLQRSLPFLSFYLVFLISMWVKENNLPFPYHLCLCPPPFFCLKKIVLKNKKKVYFESWFTYRWKLLSDYIKNDCNELIEICKRILEYTMKKKVKVATNLIR